MNRSSGTLQAPPRYLLWLVTVIFFLLVVAVLAGLSFVSSGQRLGSLIPFIVIAVVGVVVALIGGAVVFRRRLPRLMWLWVTLLAVVALAALAGGSIFAYRNILPPRYQEQVVTEMPFMRMFMPPTPEGGAVPTVAPREGGLSAEDLLALPLPQVSTEDAAPPTVTPSSSPEATEAVSEPAVVLAPSETPIPSVTPTSLPPTDPPATPIPPTSIPATTAPQQQTSNFSRPAATRMYGFTYVRQGWNNCGPANITMALSHYGWRENQDYAANILKPNKEDKNVSPAEMVSFVREQTQVSAITRMGGDMELIKDFIAANIPIIVETGYYLEGENWLGHYQTVVGYDDNQSVFYIFDSWLGTGTDGAGLPEHYSDFDANWRYFNRAFIVIYERDRENVVQQILSDRADVTRADERALAAAQQEASANRQDALAWFNLGTSYTRLGQYELGAAAYDQAFRLGTLPFRMLWYQFGPFEAYFETGRYDEVTALINSNLSTAGNYVEETFFWQGKVFAAQGQTQQAAASFQRAIAQNPRYQAARDALGTLNL
ncbi:MAG: C39 family peptidase [Anaerolineae bacterium]|nr:C39 family peptidase [Anaerolineae bacterium]